MARPMVVGRRYPPAVERRWTHPSHAPTGADVVVIGGGIIGCAAAAIMADRGAAVVLVEETAIGAGASGRNLGAIQHPFDPVLAALYVESLSRYRALAGLGAYGFTIGAAPAGLLLLNRDAAAAAGQARRIAETFPDLEPELVEPDELQQLEPSLAPGPAAVRLETGFPVPPNAATAAWAALAEDHGAAIVVGTAARPLERDGRAAGAVLADGSTTSADAVLVAAGPWTPPLVDPSGAWRPIYPTWGVTVGLRLGGNAPRHIVEEDEVDGLSRAESAAARASDLDDPDADPPSLFSLATAGGITTLGSTFLPTEPDPARIGSLLLRRAAAFLPAVVEAELVARRMCARPQSIDGRPFIGAVPHLAGLYVCAGHGPWGISTGPASAAIVARAILDGTAPPPQLVASRRT
jgi:glycine/D-amino acid oxidase-like deaminating enzyme